MKMQKIIIYAASLIVMTYLGYQVYILQSERLAIKGEFDEIQGQYGELQSDNERLQGDIEYLSDPHNLEKELRARFNYRSPNEKLIIVVPEEEKGDLE
ncbi:MAG: hypothetical protein UX31_C0010G0025 [Candidatus Nomurabacteria bacterium GW2011_GWA1_46_11]|uniref:Cell division protein FtsL n=2 Tax=Parcubacteria group TaxID=1794811 RepID=A0A1G1YUX6_9BACT|nr:MAG: hypothetical protein UX29_C0008G0013 [Parcubacteria group bacterium GW2011_GWA2_46_10]KKU21894.1 MAG: hypothetical protein UX31_C0010G0025 [Candidatus Nomurabacteria bacterium GW2011_GWA1_46_11]OGY56172.1 MAG: hypothetical protein A2119_00890 [Candidatus Colwellbacteria bacterium GWA2_46_10]